MLIWVSVSATGSPGWGISHKQNTYQTVRGQDPLQRTSLTNLYISLQTSIHWNSTAYQKIILVLQKLMKLRGTGTLFRNECNNFLKLRLE